MIRLRTFTILTAMLLTILLAGGCKCRQKTQPAKEDVPAEAVAEIALEKEELPDYSNVMTVNFISRGEGIDHAARRAFDELLKTYAENHPDFITVQIKNWGREGEKEYCIHFVLDDESLRIKFLEETQALLTDNERVFVQNGVKCKSER
jgi:hypothetical protein